jgi:hypothetical protein
VTGERRRAISTPGERRDPARRGPASVVVSIAIHVVAIAVLVRVAIVPLDWARILGRPAEPTATHVDYVRSLADSGTHARPKAGGDNHAITKVPPAAPLVAPSEVPSALPPEPPKSAAVPQPPGGSGEVIGSGGPMKGVTPAFTDPRIWAPTDAAPIRQKTQIERLDSAIATRVHHLQDSLAAFGTERAPGDWTFGKDGKKYGIDQKFIHLGSFSIPTAILALLPLNVQGNPATYENARRIGAARSEIMEQDARASRDADFNEAVRDLRQRRQKERSDKAKADQTIPDAPPPVKIIP